MILITTAGKVGSEASRLLAGRGVPLRVLAHHLDKAAARPETTGRPVRKPRAVPAESPFIGNLTRVLLTSWSAFPSDINKLSLESVASHP
jgi:hypothetical protein